MKAWSLAVGAAIVLMAAGCGGTTVGEGSDGGSSGSGSSGGNTSGGGSTSGGGGGGCPASPPANGAPCSQSDLGCEWGSSPVPDCNTQAVCTAGQWMTTAPSAGTFDCGGSPPIACPSSFAAVPVTTACSPSGGICDYPEGRCACSPPAGPPTLSDSGVVTEWFCQQPSLGCPQRRPLLGSACPFETMSCDYGSCTIPGGSVQQCTGGVWVAGLVGCPL
jgi:hypothetical protein